MLPPKPENEEGRLAAIERYHILDAPPDEDFDEITRLVAKICQVPVALINLVDRDRTWAISEHNGGMREGPLEISFCTHTILQSDIFIVPDARKDVRFANNPIVTGAPFVRFYAGALLKTPDNEPIGSLCVFDRVVRELSEEQIELLTVAARQVMKQLELRRLLLEQKQLIKEKEEAKADLDRAYAHEKKIAETLQRSLLIEIPENAFPDLNVVSLYEAAWSEAEVGGDFYDAFSLGSTHVALVMGDVAGKGVEAAARTAEVKYALRAFLQETRDPVRTMVKLNDFLCQFHDFSVEASPRFVVVALCIIDVSDGTASIVHAGADGSLLLRNDGSAEIFASTGLPLGIDKVAQYTLMTLKMEPGETFIMATDGLTEARQANYFLGLDGLTQLAIEAQSLSSLTERGNAILCGAKQFAGGNLRDDASLLLAQYTSVSKRPYSHFDIH